MGALDDAIREHLELKRQHGADEDAIRQAEAEALGPARRTPGAGFEPALDEVGMAAPDAAFDDDEEPPPPAPDSAVHDAPPPPPGLEPDPEPLVELVPDPAVAEVEPLAAPEPLAPDASPTGVHSVIEEPPLDEPPPIEEEPPPAPLDDDPDPDRTRTAILDDPLGAPPPDEPPPPARPPEAAGAEGEDVLEETPDFLEETPEHDRLWFEQKPPRDFDFD